MKDRLGMEYGEAVRIQQQHLTLWSERLKLPSYNAVAEYVLKHNRVAENEHQAHHVYRGQDIVQIILDWPELKPMYPAVKDDPMELI